MRGMNRKSHIDAAGVAMLVAFSLLLATNQVAIKLTNGGFGPVFLAGLRSAIAMVALLIWMRARGISAWLPPGTRIPAICLGLLFAYEFVCLFLALDMTTVGRASIMFYSMPVWTAIGAHFLIPGDRLNATRALGLVLAMAGVVLALADRGGHGQSSLTGDFLALIGAFGWAGIALIVRATRASELRPEQQLCWQLAVSAPILIAIAPLFGPLLRDPQAPHWAGVAFQSLAVAFAGFLFWFWLMRTYPASGVASFGFLTPVFSVALGALLLREVVALSVVGAVGLVALGLVLINRKPAQRG
jgi:drug/metabolite transporter (DMT)-like permease